MVSTLEKNLNYTLERALLSLDIYILATFLNNARQQATEYSSTIQLRFELIPKQRNTQREVHNRLTFL